MGSTYGVDVTVVGSGPNGLAAAVVCARAGLSVQVLEAQPTLGGGARTLPDPEYPGVRHDICSAVHPLALGSPFFAEFDLAARGVGLTVPEISYANPFVERPAAIAYRDLDRTAEGLDDGKSWRRLLEPMVQRADGVVDFLLGDKRSLPTDPVLLLQLGLRMAWQGTASVERDVRRPRRGGAVHRRCGAYDFTAAVDHVSGGGNAVGQPRALRRLADTGRGQSGHCGRVDRGPARARRRAAQRYRSHRAACRGRAVRHGTDRAVADLRLSAATRVMQTGCGAIALAPVWRRWISCCQTTCRGRTRGWRRRSRFTSAVIARTWRTPRLRSLRGGMPSGRWCWPRFPTSRIRTGRRPWPAAVLDIRTCAGGVDGRPDGGRHQRRRELRTGIPRRRRRRPQRARRANDGAQRQLRRR